MKPVHFFLDSDNEMLGGPVSYKVTGKQHWPRHTTTGEWGRFNIISIHDVAIEYDIPPQTPFIKLNIVADAAHTIRATLSLDPNSPEFRFVLMDRGVLTGNWRRYKTTQTIVNVFTTDSDFSVDIYDDHSRYVPNVTRSIINMSVQPLTSYPYDVPNQFSMTQF
jgi:hypothetical protein